MTNAMTNDRERKWKCNCGDEMEGDTRCGYCMMTLRDYDSSPHQPPVREEWDERFDERFADDNGLAKNWKGKYETVIYDMKGEQVTDCVIMKDYIRSERLAAQREIVKMILEKKEMVTCNNCNEQCINGDIGYYVSVSDIEDIGKGLGIN